MCSWVPQRGPLRPFHHREGVVGSMSFLVRGQGQFQQTAGGGFPNMKSKRGAGQTKGAAVPRGDM